MILHGRVSSIEKSSPPEVVGPVVNVLNAARVDNLLPIHDRALHAADDRPELVHRTVVLRASVQPHVGVLQQRTTLV